MEKARVASWTREKGASLFGSQEAEPVTGWS